MLADKPIFEPRQVAGTFTLDGGERLAIFVIWKPLKLLVSHGPEADHRVGPEGLLLLWNLPEDLAAERERERDRKIKKKPTTLKCVYLCTGSEYLPRAHDDSSLRCMLGLGNGQQVIKAVLEPAFLPLQRNI